MGEVIDHIEVTGRTGFAVFFEQEDVHSWILDDTREGFLRLSRGRTGIVPVKMPIEREQDLEVRMLCFANADRHGL